MERSKRVERSKGSAKSSEPDSAVVYENKETEPLMVREALSIMEKVRTITDRGHNAEIKKKSDGSYTVYDVAKVIR